MPEKRRGLGKGLGALIPSGPQAVPQTERPVDMLFKERSQDGGQGHRNPLIPLGPDVETVSPGFAPAPTAPSPGTKRRTTPGAAKAGKTRKRSDARPVSRETAADTTGEPKEVVEAPVIDLGKDVEFHSARESSADSDSRTASREEAPSDAAVDDAVASKAASVGSGRREEPAARPDPLRQDILPAEAVETEQGEAKDATSSFETATAESAGSVAETGTKPDSPSDDNLLTVPGAVLLEIPVDQIRINPRQPRTVFDEEALEELRQSILQVGVLQPVVVRSVPGEDGYELIMGERRLRASQAAGLQRLPAIVRDTSDDEMLRDALLENLHRANLNPLEEAAAYDQLLADFGCTHEELAERIGRSRPQISNTIRLLRLPALVQRRVAAGVLSSGHARALLSLADPAAMERLAQRIVAEGLSVRATEEIVSMGTVEKAAPRAVRPAPRLHGEALDAITTRLSDVLETRVSAAMSKRKGRLTIEFADMDDLNRILTGLSPRLNDTEADDDA